MNWREWSIRWCEYCGKAFEQKTKEIEIEMSILCAKCSAYFLGEEKDKSMREVEKT